MFRRFGSHVTVIQRGKQLLTGEDSDIADAIAAILREDGIDILLEAKTESATTAGNNVTLSVKVQGENRQLSGNAPAGRHRSPAKYRQTEPAGGRHRHR